MLRVPGDVEPITTKFRLGESISVQQKRFLEYYGFLHFEEVVSGDELRTVLDELDRIEERWIEEKRKLVYGIPLFWGRNAQGQRFLQRFAFASQFSEAISEFVNDKRFEPIRLLVGQNARVGEQEKDGVVVNRYLNVPMSSYQRLGWHTDGLRDLFYFRMPLQMLNVGVHFDHCSVEDGALRLIPGTHKQGFWDMAFRKPYFISHHEDPNEIVVETRPGDVTIHDGRLWHRVARSKKSPGATLRRTMYVPYLTGPYEPKSEFSRTPSYHRLGQVSRTIKGWLTSFQREK